MTEEEIVAALDTVVSKLGEISSPLFRVDTDALQLLLPMEGPSLEMATWGYIMLAEAQALRLLALAKGASASRAAMRMQTRLDAQRTEPATHDDA